MIRLPPRSTLDRSSAASDVYKRQPVTITQEFRGLGPDPHVDMLFPGAPPLVESLTLEIRDLNAGEDVKLSLIHISEPTRPD